MRKTNLRISLRASAITLVLMCSTLAVSAQNTATNTEDEPEFIVPARPTVSNPAEFQRPGVLQVEFGYNGNYHAKDVAAEHDAPLAVRFAASRRLLFEFDSDSPISQKVNGSRRETGVGDFQLGVQYVVQHESTSKPGVALAYYIKLPAADSTRGLGTGRTDHNFIALISKKIGETTIDFNAVYLLAGRTTNNGHASSGQAALAATRPITKRTGVFAELSGLTRNDAQSGALFGLSGATYQVNKRLVFDAGIRTGLTRATPHVGIVAGMSVGIADLYKKH